MSERSRAKQRAKVPGRCADVRARSNQQLHDAIRRRIATNKGGGSTLVAAMAAAIAIGAIDGH